MSEQKWITIDNYKQKQKHTTHISFMCIFNYFYFNEKNVWKKESVWKKKVERGKLPFLSSPHLKDEYSTDFEHDDYSIFFFYWVGL